MELLEKEMLKLYKGQEHRTLVLAKLKQAADKLGKPGAAARIAAKILAAARRFKVADAAIGGRK